MLPDGLLSTCIEPPFRFLFQLFAFAAKRDLFTKKKKNRYACACFKAPIYGDSHAASDEVHTHSNQSRQRIIHAHGRVSDGRGEKNEKREATLSKYVGDGIKRTEMADAQQSA